MRQIKTNAKKSNVVRDIKVNTQIKADEMGRIPPAGKDQPATLQEVEEDTIIINPDPGSMESRG